MKNVEKFYEEWHSLMIKGENDEEVAEEFEKLAEKYELTEYEWELMCEYSSNIKYLEMNKNLVINELEKLKNI